MDHPPAMQISATTQNVRSMAPSKSHLALFLAIVLIAATPQPSAAVRAKAPAPSTNNDLVAKPLGWCLIPCPPILPPFLCIPPIFCPPTPSAPPPPPPPSKPQPKECLSPLMKLTACKDFLTNNTAENPPYPGSCCDAYKYLFEEVPVCFCRITDVNLDKLMSGKVIYKRLMAPLEDICEVYPPSFNCYGPVPPLEPAPSPQAAP